MAVKYLEIVPSGIITRGKISIMTHKKRTRKQSFLSRGLHHLANLLVPRSHNRYHPHLIGRYGLAIIAIFGLSSVYFAANQHAVAVLGAEPTISASALLRDVNAERVEQGESTLVISDKLSAAALAKGKHMFEEQYWAHISPSGITPWKWVQDQDYSYTHAGENLAKNYPSAKATVAAWMASPTHRENMLQSHYREVGFAAVDGELDGVQTTIIVALFATPASSDTVVIATTDSGDVGSVLGFLPRIGVSLQSMNPAVLGALSLAAIAMVIAIITFATTRMRASDSASATKSKTQSHGAWHRHHTVGKTIGLSAFVLFTMALFGGGQL